MEKNKLNEHVELLVIGGSAGSFDVLMHIIPSLKKDIDFPILIILHRKSTSGSTIADVFSLKTTLPVVECEEKEQLLPGKIYFAPADYHLLIEDDHSVSLDYSEKVNYSRPSIDVSFKSASDIFKKNIAAILLSGANADGAEGLSYIHKNNGTTIVQNPQTAEVKIMPQRALSLFNPDYIVDMVEMSELINSFNS